jgi:hypothetical protein
MRVRCRSGALALAVLAGLAAPGLAGEKTAQSGSEGRQRVLRSWESTDKVNGADVYRRMEVVFNYDSGVAQQRAYDAEGRLLSSRTVAQPRPTREEMAEAVAIIEKDPKLGRIVQRAKPVYEGGSCSVPSRSTKGASSSRKPRATRADPAPAACRCSS